MPEGLHAAVTAAGNGPQQDVRRVEVAVNDAADVDVRHAPCDIRECAQSEGLEEGRAGRGVMTE